jgi:hypothetical protein
MYEKPFSRERRKAQTRKKGRKEDATENAETAMTQSD